MYIDYYVLTILWITILLKGTTKECIYGFLLKSNDLLEK